jgi:putative copper export protein
MDSLLVVIHLLSAAVWIGGSVVLVFVAIPVMRSLPRAERAPLLRRIAIRWHPIGYGSLATLGVSGLLLGEEHHAFGDPILRLKIVLGLMLFALALLHDFVLGPRYAKRAAEGPARGMFAWLVSVGWASFSLTLILPILGVVLATRLET